MAPAQNILHQDVFFFPMIVTAAGISVKISSTIESMPLSLITFLNSFSVNCQEPEFNLSIKDGFNKEFQNNKVAGNEYTISEHEQGFAIEHYDVRLSISFATNLIEIYLSSPIEDAPTKIIDCIKWIFSFLIIFKGGIPLHCSLAYRNNIAFGFLGPSETGKTTILKLLGSGWEKGNDEFNAIIPRNGYYMFYSTPFKASVPFSMGLLKPIPNPRLFFLKQCKTNYFENIPKSTKYFNLLKNVYTLAASRSLGDKLLENTQNVCNTVPMQTLHFINNETIATFLACYGKKKN
jgi:hypothetical protein